MRGFSYAGVAVGSPRASPTSSTVPWAWDVRMFGAMQASSRTQPWLPRSVSASASCSSGASCCPWPLLPSSPSAVARHRSGTATIRSSWARRACYLLRRRDERLCDARLGRRAGLRAELRALALVPEPLRGANAVHGSVGTMGPCGHGRRGSRSHTRARRREGPAPDLRDAHGLQDQRGKRC